MIIYYLVILPILQVLLYRLYVFFVYVTFFWPWVPSFINIFVVEDETHHDGTYIVFHVRINLLRDILQY